MVKFSLAIGPIGPIGVLHFNAFAGGDPLRISGQNLPLQKRNSFSYLMLKTTRSYLHSSGHLPQCKTSIGNSFGSIKQGPKVCVQYGVFGDGESNGVTAIFVT